VGLLNIGIVDYRVKFHPCVQCGGGVGGDKDGDGGEDECKTEKGQGMRGERERDEERRMRRGG